MGLARTAGRPAGSHCACIGSIFWGKRKKVVETGVALVKNTL